MKFIPLFDENGRACRAEVVGVAGGDTPTPSPMAVPGFTPFEAGSASGSADSLMQRQLDLLSRQVQRLKDERRQKQAAAAATTATTIASTADGGERAAAASTGTDTTVTADGGVPGAPAAAPAEPGTESDESEGELSSDSDPDDPTSTPANGVNALQSSGLPPLPEGQGGGGGPSGGGSTTADGPMMRYVNELGNPVCIFRAILPHMGKEGEGCPAVTTEISGLHSTGKWLVLLLHGGHFAGAILKNGRVTHHKCFHRYVVRAKRGTVQSQADNKSGTKAPKSAGASIRRHNETALKDEISLLLKSWAAEIATCHLAFCQAPTTTRGWFFGPKAGVLTAADPRVRKVPFPTKRPTLKEILRIYTKLSAVYDDPDGPAASQTPAGADGQGPATAPAVATAEGGEGAGGEGGSSAVRATHDAAVVAPLPEAGFVDAPLYTALTSDPPPTLEAATAAVAGLSPDEVNYGWNTAGETALHAAARLGGTFVTLLLEANADPTLANERGKVPFALAADKPTRDAFRRFMAAHPTAWDYSVAQVPSALTAEMEAKQAAKAKADKKRAKERKKKADKARAEAARKAAEAEAVAEAERLAAAEAKRARDEQRKREKAMTPRERAAAAALARAQAAAAGGGGGAGGSSAAPTASSGGVCDYCGGPMPSSGGFEKLSFVYCQPRCMREHTPPAV